MHLHTHLAETEDEEAFCLQKFGYRPVAYMQSVDWVGQDVWFAHAVHVNAEEMQTFARHGCGVAHCPSSNMRLASGIAPVREYLAAGVKVGLGVDGSASNDGSHLLAEVRQAMLLARLREGLAGFSLSNDPRSQLNDGPRRPWNWPRAAAQPCLGRSDIGVAGSRQMCRFLRHRSEPAGVRRGAARPGRCGGLLPAAAGRLHGGRRQVS